MVALRINLNKMAGFLLGAIFLTLLVFLGFYIDRKQAPKIRKRVEELYLSGNFSTATNLGSTTSTYGTFQDIIYGFKTPNGGISTGLGYNKAKLISEGTFTVYKNFLTDVKKEDTFLVLYDKNDPKNSILLLCHPIKSDEDFARYVAEIEELRKNPKWRGYK
jgi:hypothetical protein